MKIAKSTLQALTIAAQSYEAAIKAGELKCDAFAEAIRAHNAEVRRQNNAAPRQYVLVSRAVRATVDGYLAQAYPEHYLAIRDRIASGKRGGRPLDTVRAEVIAVLKRARYHEKVIGAAVGRDRTSVICCLRDTVPRLMADPAFRARVDRFFEGVRAVREVAA